MTFTPRIVSLAVVSGSRQAGKGEDGAQQDPDEDHQSHGKKALVEQGEDQQRGEHQEPVDGNPLIEADGQTAGHVQSPDGG